MTDEAASAPVEISRESAVVLERPRRSSNGEKVGKADYILMGRERGTRSFRRDWIIEEGQQGKRGDVRIREDEPGKKSFLRESGKDRGKIR